MKQNSEKKDAAEIYNTEVQPALNKLRLLYAISVDGFRSDWIGDFGEGIKSAQSDMIEEVINAIDHFSDSVFTDSEGLS